MAFGSKNVIASRTLSLPSGHSQTTVDPVLANVDIRENASLIIACSGVVAATEAAGCDALFTAIQSAVDTVIDTDMGVDTTGNTVDYVFTVNSIKEEDSFSLYLNDATRNYVVQGVLSVNVYAV